MSTIYQPTLSRAHWAGADADRDIHIELYEGSIDGSFRVESLFRSMNLTTWKPVTGRSNTWRGDRVGGAEVKGRRSGEALDQKRIVNEKFLVTVDTTSYISTAVDYQDDWTAPSFQAEYSAEHATAHAKAFDVAHMIQLIKAGEWKAPATLKESGAFNDGLTRVMSGYAAETSNEAKADMIVQAHKDALAEFVLRDLGGSLAEFVTLMEPKTFAVLLDHKKLMNLEYQGGDSGNSFSQRRIAYLNGTRVIETPRFPRAAIPDHFLGAAFNVTAAEAKSLFILFQPRKTLVTVEAQPMTVRYWDDKGQFSNVLDSYNMYTVGVKRGDAVFVGRTD